MNTKRYPTVFIIISLMILSTITPMQAKASLSAISMELSASETKWIDDHPVIRIAPDPDFPPIDFFDADGKYKGIAADFIALVEKNTGLRFMVVRCRSWEDVLERLKTRQADAIPAAAQTQARTEYLLFSDPHIVLPGVIIVRKDVTGTLNVEDLLSIKVSVVKGYVWQESLYADYPDLDLDLVPDLQTALRKVSLGETDAVVATMPVAIHHIDKEGITNLRIAGETPYHTRLSFASRKDWPELNSIVKKVLVHTPKKDKDAILNKWISIEKKSFFKSERFQGITVISVLQLFFILSFFFVWRFQKKRFIQMYPHEKPRSFIILLGVLVLFIALGIIVWSDEIFDIPHLLLKAEETPANISEAIFETVFIYLVGMIVVSLFIHDIKLRKISEKELERGEETYRTIFETTGNATVIFDKDGRLLLVNKEFEKLSGYPRDDLVGKKTWMDFVSKKDLERITTYHQSALANPNPAPQNSEFQFIDSHGSIRDVLLSAAMIPETDKNVSSLLDITTAKKLEAQLRQAQKMEAIGTLAGGIAHDFNNILTAVQWNAALVIKNIDPGDKDYKRLLNIIHAAQNATNLTKQLLGFARGGKYEIKPTDLNELIEEDTNMFARTKKEISLHTRYQKDLWTVEADKSQISQVLINLYLNASQAMPEGGHLYIETKNVYLDEKNVHPFKVVPGMYVKVSVTDTGIGMDEATKSRIFEPFFTTKETGKGTGLGLASAYGIIKNHGGFITLYSEKDKGSCFNIYLRATDKKMPKKQDIVEKDLRGTETLLLVDDEDDILDAGKDILINLGYKIITARDGKEALKVYRDNHDKIDLVILDMIMPGFSGGSTYDALKEIDPAVRVILSSGYSLNGQAAKILARGCNGFIQKPYMAADLSRKIKEVLGADDTPTCPDE